MMRSLRVVLEKRRPQFCLLSKESPPKVPPPVGCMSRVGVAVPVYVRQVDIVRHRHSTAVVSCCVLFRRGLSIVERSFCPSPSKILAERRGAEPAARNHSSWKSKEVA
jgi:hypothetical protein